jgi:hypothetical protein
MGTNFPDSVWNFRGTDAEIPLMLVSPREIFRNATHWVANLKNLRNQKPDPEVLKSEIEHERQRLLDM